MRDAPPVPAAVARVAPPTIYKSYASSHEIDYSPEAALKEGLAMVKSINQNIKKLELGSKLRKDVWQREIDRCVVFHYLFICCRADKF